MLITVCVYLLLLLLSVVCFNLRSVILFVLIYFGVEYTFFINYIDTGTVLYTVNLNYGYIEVIPNYKLLELDKVFYLKLLTRFLDESVTLLSIGTLDQLVYRGLVLKSYYLSVCTSYDAFLSGYPSTYGLQYFETYILYNKVVSVLTLDYEGLVYYFKYNKLMSVVDTFYINHLYCNKFWFLNFIQTLVDYYKTSNLYGVYSLEFKYVLGFMCFFERFISFVSVSPLFLLSDNTLPVGYLCPSMYSSLVEYNNLKLYFCDLACNNDILYSSYLFLPNINVSGIGINFFNYLESLLYVNNNLDYFSNIFKETVIVNSTGCLDYLYMYLVGLLFSSEIVVVTDYNLSAV